MASATYSMIKKHFIKKMKDRRVIKRNVSKKSSEKKLSKKVASSKAKTKKVKKAASVTQDHRYQTRSKAKQEETSSSGSDETDSDWREFLRTYDFHAEESQLSHE